MKTDVQADLEARAETEDRQRVLTPNALKVEVKTDVQVDLEVKAETEDRQRVHTPNALKVEVMTDVQVDLEAKAETEDHQHVVVETKEEVALTETKTMTADQRVQPENRVVLTWLGVLTRAI